MLHLNIEKSGLIKGGGVDYEVSKIGVVSWSGTVKINMGITTSSKSFSGSYNLGKEYAKSSAYRHPGDHFDIEGAQIDVISVDEDLATVHIKASGAEGDAVLFLENKLVEIDHADFDVKALGMNFKVKLRS